MGVRRVLSLCFLSVGSQEAGPFSTPRLSFYEDNDDPRVILLASLQALRGSQPDAFTFLCLSFENSMSGHIHCANELMILLLNII